MKHPSKGSALITGASSGIGAAYADRLARRGHDVILVARNAKRLSDLALRLNRDAGVRADVLVADLTDPAGLVRVEHRIRTDSSITILINNAGATLRSGVIGTDLAVMDSIVSLNVLAVTHLATVAATAFVARGNGTIVNICVDRRPNSGALPRNLWPPLKAYVFNFSLSLNAEIGDKGVRVQVVLPATVRTEIFERAGKTIDAFDPAIVMEPGELVDAALAGLDQGEVVTLPSLPDRAVWGGSDRRSAAAGSVSRTRKSCCTLPKSFTSNPPRRPGPARRCR